MTNETKIDLSTLTTAADTAARHIPPVWPLASSVAVNPYLGQMHEGLAEAGARVGGIAVTMPREWYLERITSGQITDADLTAALNASPHDHAPETIEALKLAAQDTSPTPEALPDLVARAEKTDWPGLLAERFGTWASGYFDGQALWPRPAAEARGTRSVSMQPTEIMGF